MNNTVFARAFPKRSKYTIEEENKLGWRQPPFARAFPKRSKGQMFIIAAIIILIGLIILKSLLGIYTTVEEKRYQETSILDKQLRNIKNEYERLSGLAFYDYPSGIQHLSDFSALTDKKVLYMVVFVNESNYKVTVANFIDDKINCTLTATSSTPSEYKIGTLNHAEYVVREFHALSSNVDLTLTYQAKGSVITEAISLDTTKNATVSFFDITLDKKDMFVRTKDTYEVMS